MRRGCMVAMQGGPPQTMGWVLAGAHRVLAKL